VYNMNQDRKKELKEQYINRHPKMGVICWKSKDKMWIDISKDSNADYNGTSFQLKLGSWVNKELQRAYTSDPESFEFILLKELDYEDYNDDHSDDLEILLMEVLDDYPDALPLRTKKFKK